MADLTNIQSAEAVKIIGSTSNGTETNPVGATQNLELNVADVLNNGGVNSNLSVGTTAVELKVGASRLAARKFIILQPRDNGIFYGFSSGVTAANGIEVFKSQILMLPVGENTEVWLIGDTAGKNIRIAEVA